MKIGRKILKWIFGFLMIPVFYLVISLILTYIPIHDKTEPTGQSESIYISSNGVHLDIIIPVEKIDPEILSGLRYTPNDQFLSFAWGDKNFYLNTPEWSDMTFGNAFKALFLKSPALIHLNRYSAVQKDWVAISVNRQQLKSLNNYILGYFYLDANNSKVILDNKGYSETDDFYEALGSYSCFKTSNSWVNNGLRKSKIRSCLWTPFDFGLIDLHKK